MTSVSTARAENITYNFLNYATSQGAYTIQGTIVTDGNLGALTSADIVSATVGVTGPGGYAPTQVVETDLINNVINLVATGSTLFLNDIPNVTSNLNLWTERTNPVTQLPEDAVLIYYTSGFPTLNSYRATNADNTAWLWNVTPSSESGDANNIGYNPMVIAAASPAPEPATMTMIWALLGLAGVVYLRRRGAKA